MKRDKKLMYLLLLQARDEVMPPGLESYPDDAQIYNAGLLVDDGFVQGSSIPKPQGGGYLTVAMDGLTSAGHDFLDELENQMGTALPMNESNGLAVFISHSAKDAVIAEALVNLLRSGIGLTEKDIRCTSVDGYRFKVGSETDAQLKKEVKSSKTFIGLITPSSIQSAYVLFELGARWGANLHLAPLLAAGADTTFLRGPLAGLNALLATEEGQIFQLVSDIAETLKYKLATPDVYSKAVREFASLAAMIVSPASQARDHLSVKQPRLDKEAEQFLKLLFNAESLSVGYIALNLGISEGMGKYYCDVLGEADMIRFAGDFDEFDSPNYSITPKGRAYVVDHFLTSN